jgi:hypothetical protein
MAKAVCEELTFWKDGMTPGKTGWCRENLMAAWEDMQMAAGKTALLGANIGA